MPEVVTDRRFLTDEGGELLLRETVANGQKIVWINPVHQEMEEGDFFSPDPEEEELEIYYVGPTEAKEILMFIDEPE